MDEVFKALADPTRRGLLDELYREDGQSLTALERRLPMTRIAVMKHLKVLEGAGLVTTRRRGREKLHFLNPVPIRLVHDRWVSKYAEPWAATLTGLKKTLEAQMEQVFEIYIKTTPERLWEAIVDPDLRARYSFGVRVESDWTNGSTYSSTAGEHAIAEGENLEVDPPRRLVQTWGWEPGGQGDIEPSTTRIEYELISNGDATILRFRHELPTAKSAESHAHGWDHYFERLVVAAQGGDPGIDPWIERPMS